MYDLEAKSTTQFDTKKNVKPIPLVRFEMVTVNDGKELSTPETVKNSDREMVITTPMVKIEPDVMVRFIEDSQEIELTKAQLPISASNNTEISIISDERKAMIRNQQEELQIRAAQIQNAERFGKDYYIENGIIHNMAGEKICNFYLNIVSETINYYKSKNGYYTRNQYKLQIRVYNSIYEVNIWADDIHDFKWLRKVTEGKANIYDAAGKKNDFLNELLCELQNNGNYDVYHYYDTSGWHNIPGMEYRYLYDKGIIGMKNSNTYADIEHKLIYDESKVGSKSIFQDILRMMLNVCKNPAISIVIGLYSHIGVMTTLYELADFPVKFIVALIGVTNARKTSLALSLTKLFDRCAALKPEISFEATIGGIETSFSKYKDAVFVIDDLKPANSKEKQKEAARKLEKIVRAYGDRVPTIRMNDFSPTNREVFYPICGCCMITGEYIDGVASTLARIITIPIDGNEVDNTELRYFQKNYKILSTHMVDFISYVTDNFNNIVSFINTRIENIRYEVDKLFNISRYKESYATFLTCAEIFIRYALDRRFLNEYEAQEYLAQFKAGIYSIIKSNDGSMVEYNPGIMALKAIDYYIDSGIIRIYFEGQIPVQGEEFYAYQEDGYLCIKLDTTYRILTKYLRSLNADPSVTTPKQLLPFLQSLDVIRVEKKGNETRSTHKLRGRNNESRFLFIKINKMKELLANVNLY